MSKSAIITRDVRFQQWVEQVKQFNARPSGMSMTSWCRENGISVSTFATRLHKVQDRCIDQLELVPSIPDTSFVELSEIKPKLVNTSTASIVCGNARIEINESISDAFLIRLIGAASHA